MSSDRPNKRRKQEDDSYELARQIMQETVPPFGQGYDSYYRCPERLAKMLEMLWQRPKLAQEKFSGQTPCSTPNDVVAYPLSFVVIANADLETVRRVYELHPPALLAGMQLRGSTKTSALLDRAIFYHVRMEVVQFLMDECPQGVSQVTVDELWNHRDEAGRFCWPKESEEAKYCDLFLSFLDICPDLLLRKGNFYDMLPLFSRDLVEHRMESFATRWVGKIKCLSLLDDTKEQEEFENICFIDPDTATALVPLLANVQELSFGINDNSNQAMGYSIILDALSSSQTLKKLVLKIDSMENNPTNVRLFNSLQNFIQKNSSLEDLQMGFFSSTFLYNLDLPMKALTASRYHFPRKLKIEGLEIDEATDVKYQFLEGCQSEELFLDCSYIDGPWERPHSSRLGADMGAPCSVKKLTLTSYSEWPPSAGWVNGCLSYVGEEMCFLKSLSVDGFDLDPMDGLLSLLGRGVLEELSLASVGCDMGRLFQSMKANTGLKILKVLKTEQVPASLEDKKLLLTVLRENNTTLEVVDLSDDGTPAQVKIATDIRLSATLNRMGRSKVRNPNFHIEEFVDLLCHAKEHSENDYEVHALQHGLLTEAPSYWCERSTGC